MILGRSFKSHVSPYQSVKLGPVETGKTNTKWLILFYVRKIFTLGLGEFPAGAKSVNRRLGLKML